MNTECFAGIDLGTSGIKVVIADSHDRLLASASRGIETRRLHEGWNEQHPDQWWQAVCDCFDELAVNTELMARISGIGLSGQMLGPVLIDKHNKPLTYVMLWNDGRSTLECAELLERVPNIGLRTNCTPDPGVGAPKLMWLLKHHPDIIERCDCLLLPKDYIRLLLTGERFSEPSDAGGTMLMECATSIWSDEICQAVGWKPSALPDLCWSWEQAGELKPELCKRFNMPSRVPVAAGAGDNMACSLGVGVAQPGDCAITIGTSGVICTVSSEYKPIPQSAFLTSHHGAPDAFLSMGVVMSATGSIDWLSALLGQSVGSLSNQVDALFESGKAFESPLCAPWLNGIRTPHNAPTARAKFEGISLLTDSAMLAWSIFEGVAFQFKECAIKQEEAGISLNDIVLVGGGSNNALWCKLIATLLQQPLSLPEGRHLAACLGATRLAQVIAGVGSAQEILSRKPEIENIIEPDPAIESMLFERFDRYLKFQIESG